MDGKVACVECTQKCLLDHGNKKKASPDVASFFKVMIGDRFSKLLFLPPKFAPTVSALVNKKAVLEDSLGLQWEVIISRINGSLSLKQGWNAFSLDHDLKIGEFLIFSYITSSHFIVKIYDKSGCEKLNFPKAINQKKRTRDNRKYTFKAGPSHTIDRSSMNKRDSRTSVVHGSDADIGQHLHEMNDTGKDLIVTENASARDNSNERSKLNPKEAYIEEMICMFDRDVGDKQEEDRTYIFDLSDFEMLKKNSGTGGSNEVTAMDETCTDHDDSLLRLRNGAGPVDKNPVAKGAVTTAIPMDETCSDHDDSLLRLINEAGSVDKSPVAKEAVTAAIPSDASKFDGSRINNSSETKVQNTASPSHEGLCICKTSGHLFPKAALKPEENEIISNISNRAINKCLTADGSESLSGNDVVISGKEHDLIDDSCQSANKKISEISESFDKTMKAIKIESVELTSDPCSQKIIPQINGESVQVVNPVWSEISNMIRTENDSAVPVVKSEPVDPVITWPISSSFSCQELPMRLPIRMTYRGRPQTDRRVVYLRDPVMRLWPVLYIERNYFKTLASGWEAFSKANNIQPGDECVIGIENGVEGICSVQIISK
ncbi:hypothetical protein L3X38_029012 [Prunus dulcis]|uniref:TF-B3 domain-containing protein n=1 Tax=Prunus dulcis TaxID=3755 RepID=A0AAD4VQW0_PRUDU|nr:hypothetical protein L3X38_029012 [Prunus dulcis]